MVTNDNWREHQEAELIEAGLAPNDDREAALISSFAPGGYTVILESAGPGTGVGLIEAYHQP